jgi:ribosome-associated protein
MKYAGTLKSMIVITDEISISEEELKFKFVRSSGPGGQNVNKVSTAVQLRFDVVGSSTLPSDIRSRLMTLAGNRVTENGVLVIDAQQYSSQSQNRQAAIERLVDLIKQASIPPKVRRKTKPSAGAMQRRVESKRRRGEVKQLRKPLNDFEKLP